MFEVIQNLGIGFVHSMTPVNFGLITLGLIVGLIAGALPGVTMVMAVILMLPFTYTMDTTAAILLMTACYHGGVYGGSITAILFNIPGDPMNVPTLWDGYPMARKGLAAKALGIATLSSVIGGILSALVLTFFSPPFAKIALSFSSPEFFAIVFFGLTSVTVLGTTSVRGALISLFIGLIVATVGVDDVTGTERFTFGSPILRDGIDFLTVMIGIYAMAEVLDRLEQRFPFESITALGEAAAKLPGIREMLSMWGPLLRSFGIGTIIGAIPGAGATVAAFVSYGVEKQYSKKGKELGTGAPEGIAAPNCAANAATGGAMIPLLTLGIPGSGAAAVMLGAFLLHGIQPGPQIFTTSTDMVYTIFAAQYVANILMLFLGLLSIRTFVKVLQLPEPIIAAFILVFCFIGAYALRSNISDVWITVGAGIIGYFMRRFNYPIAPLVLGVILGPLAERNFMTTMISFHNDWTVFFTRPVSGFMMLLSIAALLLPLWKATSERRAARQDAAAP